MNTNKDFIVPGNRLIDVLDFENVRGAVSGVDGGFHKRDLVFNDDMKHRMHSRIRHLMRFLRWYCSTRQSRWPSSSAIHSTGSIGLSGS